MAGPVGGRSQGEERGAPTEQAAAAEGPVRGCGVVGGLEERARGSVYQNRKGPRDEGIRFARRPRECARCRGQAPHAAAQAGDAGAGRGAGERRGHEGGG